MSTLQALLQRADSFLSSPCDDPYQSVRLLGQGGFGCVDAVVPRSDSTKMYARKRFKRSIVSTKDRARVMRELSREADILTTLQSTHIVRLIEYYTFESHFCLILSPVAEGTLTEVLTGIDEYAFGPTRDTYTNIIKQWPYCLIQAVAYLHRMGVKHRDLKPSNVLVNKDSVLLTDFGISTITAPDEDSASNGSIGAHTYVYSAPEVIADTNQRRGRAADIFSLGCVLLEIGAALAEPPGARETFNDRKREVGGTLCYAENQQVALQWIRYLWTYDFHAAYERQHHEGSAATIGFHSSELAFLMLEPNPAKRITAPQLLDMTDSPDQPYFHLRNSSCQECQKVECRELGDPQMELHSAFKTDNSRFAESVSVAFTSLPAVDWEEAKKKGLKSHVHWQDPTERQLNALTKELEALALSAE